MRIKHIICVLFLDSSQLWKLDDKKEKLINKAEIWSSYEDFKITPNGSFHLIEYKDEQLWKKGEPNIEGYFTLEDAKSQKVMTAVSEEKIEMKGKLLMGKLVNYCFSYHYSQTSWVEKLHNIFFFLEILT